jgi:LmbE family N-acetylglucosaminyl deacetylase
MSEILRLNATDRVLAFAPHPDDESIACGGLLLAARDAGAARRVVVITDGDNNPWPQRWIEKRWRIDAGARTRWGARRRAEAQAALDVLGVDMAERQFFGLPDLGLTLLLMHDADEFQRRLREQIAEFQPTHIALPALDDRHPDHSAAHIGVRLALLRLNALSPQVLIYSVHGEAASAGTRTLELNAALRAGKQQAILRHETQMRFSRKRFLKFVGATERYRTISTLSLPRMDHPLRASLRSSGELELRLDLPRLRGANDLHLLLLIDAADESALRWRLPIDAQAERVEIRDARTDQVAAVAQWRHAGDSLVANIPLPQTALPRLGYAKLARNRAGLVVFDHFGWQTIEVQPAEFGNI